MESGGKSKCIIGGGVDTLTPTPMTSTIQDLPDSILINIISRLRMKSAKRCTAVCKAWYRLMKDEATSRYMESCYADSGSFALLSTWPDCNKANLAYLVALVSSSEEDTVGCPQLVIGGSAIVVGCCNDVLLCQGNESNYFVWEPLGGNDNWVPLPPLQHRWMESFLCGIAAHSDGSFTVIHIADCIRRRPAHRLSVQTFSNHKHNWVWKEEQMFLPPGRVFKWESTCYPQGVMYKGFMFWLGETRFLFGVADPYHSADGDSCSTSCVPLLIDLPPNFKYIKNECLETWRGNLTILQMSTWPSSVGIWILHDDDHRWSLHKQVSLYRVFQQLPLDEDDVPLGQRRVELLGSHPYDHNIIYFRVWRTVLSLDFSTMALQQLL
ncbi:unnamed protein product [Linum trigynum]|uniref:F-box domain-containing protein n=1 Tax=Linum trigynum TaxID=586398 RepID=A0AAV2F4C2_9ROSI